MIWPHRQPAQLLGSPCRPVGRGLSPSFVRFQVALLRLHAALDELEAELVQQEATPAA